ncbi:SMP-30/gluconolactonase/LRE family protein [Akkermansiaceae bacterium]|nr:SMP-30/gluconolactonase/LRE family protein [Akkermansiaceae bacterium]
MRLITLSLALASTTFAQLAPPAPAGTPRPTVGSVERLDPAINKLIPEDAKIEVVAMGFDWSEGPVWDKAGNRLLFSDVPANKVYQWSEKDGLSVFLKASGYTGPSDYGNEPGSNGLTFDNEGRLLSCEHGDRRVSVLTTNGGGKMTVADRFEGKRFNSPNDVCVHPNGTIYFTDPPYGLPQKEKDPRRESPIFGVYSITPKGQISVVDATMERPNGVTLSPDGKTLYIAQSQGGKAWLVSYPLDASGKAGKRTLLFDATPLSQKDPGMPDGLKTDQQGNIWCTGPGGVMVISPEGKLLGRILTGQRTANCAFGDDGSTLHMTADYYIVRIRTSVKGTGF